MSWVLVLALIGGCLATPLQQGNLKIVRYSANKDGLYPSQGIPIAPQPIVYNPQQPVIIEPSPLTYSSFGGSGISERDEQRHINVDEEIEAREEGVEEEPKPVEEPKADSNNEPKDETVVRVDDQKPVQSETAALVGSSVISGVKGVIQPVNIDGEQLFPSVISGQRRLIEPQPQLYSYGGLKGKVVPSHSVVHIPSVVPQQRVIYHNLQQVQHQVQQQQPIQIEEQRITGHGVQVRKPVVQYQVSPLQQPYVPREWLRRPIQLGVKGVQQPIQYFIQPVIPSDLTIVQGQKVEGQQVPQVLNLQGGVRVQQRGQSVQQDEVRVDRVDVPNVGQPEVDQPGVQDVGSVQGVQGVQGVQQHQQRPDSLSQKGVKQPVDHSVHKVVVQTSQQQVPVVGGHQVIGYQLVGQQPQQILLQQPVQQLGHSGVQYAQPVSDIQRYYQLVQTVPYQSNIPYGVQNQVIDQPIQYSVGAQQLPHLVPQQVQPVQSLQPGQHQVIQSVNPIEAPVGVSGLSVGGLQGTQRIQGVTGVQQIQLQDQRSSGVKGQSGLVGQDLRVNPRPLDQRQQRSFVGVKGVINV